MGHNNFENLLSKYKNYFTEIKKNTIEYSKVNWLLWSFYQRNYPTFNKYKHNFNWLRLVNYLTNIWLYNMKLYKIDLQKAINNWKKYLIIKYWKTWHSFWEHIHWGILFKDNIYVSPLTNMSYRYKVLQQTFNNDKIWEKNYYYSAYTLTYKGK